VLYGDPSTMQPPAAAEPEQEEMPAGLAASGAFLAQTPSDFKASWAFVLEPVGPSRTRLIERLRYWGGEGTPASRAALSMLGFGAFVMMQRQMVGIRSRAEQLASEEALPPLAMGQAVENGHEPEVPETVLAAAEPT
jgi:hypothetical protein